MGSLAIPRPSNDTVDAALQHALLNYEPPSFPSVLLRALEQLGDEVELDRVAETLAHDPRVTIKLLSITNSPAFGFRNPVLSIEHAASMLGRDQLESLILSIGVRDALPSRTEGLPMKDFWFAAARRATLARALALELEPSTAALSFTASLLQDMALPVLAQHSRGDYAQLLHRWRVEHEDLAELETDAYGFNHADVAGWMCERWSFPEDLTAAIGTHHRAQRRYSSRPPPTVRMVADLREGLEDYGIEAFVDNARLATGMPSDSLLALAKLATDEAIEVANLYS